MKVYLRNITSRFHSKSLTILKSLSPTKKCLQHNAFESFGILELSLFLLIIRTCNKYSSHSSFNCLKVRASLRKIVFIISKFSLLLHKIKHQVHLWTHKKFFFNVIDRN